MANAAFNNRKPTHSGHESVLNMFQRYGKRVTIVTVGGHRYEGLVKAFDKFTISMICTGENFPRVFFKSAIQEFHSMDV